MIFATVGSQAPFDRLIRAVDEWARTRNRTDVVAQIAAGTYIPKHIRFIDFVNPSQFRELTQDANVLVAHAGMGSIITALEFGKPIVVMPRRAFFLETRNDHQVAAAEYFGSKGRIVVAQDEHELPERLDTALALGETTRLGSHASAQLIATLRSFLDGESNPDQNSEEHAHEVLSPEPDLSIESRRGIGQKEARYPSG